MNFTANDMAQLHQLMEQCPENRKLIEKLLEHHKYSISQISHEIRNPLTLVYSTIQLIEAKHNEVQQIKHWESLKADVEYMKLLLETLSKFNNGDRLSLESVDTTAFLRRIALSFALSISESNIEFSSQIPASLPEIKVDRIRLTEALLNLLQNAKEATPAGSILFSASITTATLMLEIKDSGSGIEPERLSSIFVPFVTNKQNGTGLGLAIAQKVVTAHGGTITLVSKTGSGTTFTICLPLQEQP